MEKINQLSLEIKRVLRKRPFFKDSISLQCRELKELILSSEWYSRKVDEIDLPTEMLIHYGFYQEAIDILNAILDKEPCTYDLAFINFDLGVCYFHLGDYQKAEEYFFKVMCEDEDYCDLVNSYRKKMK